jgi:PKD repeat protein
MKVQPRRPPHGPTAARMLPLCLLLACQGETTTPTATSAPPGKAAMLVTDNVVASVAVVPDSQLVLVGSRFKITARPKNAAGQLLDRSIRWTVLDARVAKALDSLKVVMPFKALRAGTTSIKAEVDGKFRNAKLIVRGTAGAKVVLTPEQATVASGTTLQFTATGLTSAGEKAVVTVTWTATGGTTSANGLLKAGSTPGIYRMIATAGFGAADTSVVNVASATAAVAKVFLVPETGSLVPGATKQFFAYGRTAAGDSVPLPVTYSATGGTIAAGMYTAGGIGGIYRVIAKNAAGLADTAQVVISTGPAGGVLLVPDIAASRAGGTIRFAGSVLSGFATMTYGTTCGTVTAAGVFTAPTDNSNSCLVTASADGKADTTEVVLLPNSTSQGTPFGIFGMWTSPTATQISGVAPFTASHDDEEPTGLVRQIDAARSKGVHLIFAMTGGSHDRYKTDGVFDLGKWQAAMDAYNTPAIRTAVAQGVADGTIIGNSVLDEPQQSDRDAMYRTKSWGPAGTLTRARIDGLCAYAKTIFPTLPVGVFHDPAMFEPNNPYQVCQFIMAQYGYRKENGNVAAWRDATLALAGRDGMSVVFSLNILNGGRQDKDGVWDCLNTGGIGTYSPNCAMTPAQIRDWGKALGPAGCALMAWRYDAAFVGKPENQAAISDVAIALSRLPRRPCTGSRDPNTPPTAVFASSCSDLSCSFTEGSTDRDGTVSEWSWDFGDGKGSTARRPSHTYGSAGTYQVILTVKDDGNATDAVSHAVTVAAPPPPPPENAPPTAAFAPSCDGLTCALTDGSTDDDGTVTAWSWNFGDGTGSTDPSPSHSYEMEGFYQVTLVVTDDDGATGTVTQTVTVTPTSTAAVAP